MSTYFSCVHKNIHIHTQSPSSSFFYYAFILMMIIMIMIQGKSFFSVMLANIFDKISKAQANNFYCIPVMCISCMHTLSRVTLKGFL